MRLTFGFKEAACVFYTQCHCRSKSQNNRELNRKSAPLISSPSSSSFALTGMHRKSIEAAEKLRSSDDEIDDTDASKDADDSMRSSEAKAGAAVSFARSLTAAADPLKDLDSNSPSKCNSPASSPPLPPGRDPSMKDDLRSHSIAALRAKAMEHSAKVLSQSSSSLGPVSNQPVSAVIPASLSTYPSLDRQTSMSSYPFHAAASRPIY